MAKKNSIDFDATTRGMRQANIVKISFCEKKKRNKKNVHIQNNNNE